MSEVRTAVMVAKAFHESYELHAPRFDYKTRKASAVPWDQVPMQNRLLMIAVAQDLIDRGTILPGVVK